MTIFVQLAGAWALFTTFALTMLGVLYVVQFFCQRQVHKLGSKDQFSPEWTDRAYSHPDYVADAPDEALDWLETTVADQVATLTPAQLKRSGHDDPERIERMSDQWRTTLARGEMAGTILPAGEGYAVHVHAIPERGR